HVAEQDITHGFGAKGAAAGANQSNDDRFHAQTPLQTMAGFGGGGGAADTSSSTVPLGAEISMSASSWRTSPSRPRASRHSRASSLVGASTQLVHQLGPQVFDSRAHFVRNGIDALVFEEPLVQPFQVR